MAPMDDVRSERGASLLRRAFDVAPTLVVLLGFGVGALRKIKTAAK